jgi:hypothetical protein
MYSWEQLASLFLENGPLHSPSHHGPFPLQRERRPMAVALRCCGWAFGGCSRALEHPCLYCSHLRASLHDERGGGFAEPRPPPAAPRTKPATQPQSTKAAMPLVPAMETEHINTRRHMVFGWYQRLTPLS